MPDPDENYQLSDELWERIQPLLPPVAPSREDSLDDRQAMAILFSLLRIERQRQPLVSGLAAGTPLYRRCQQWRHTGVFDRLWQTGILTYDELKVLIHFSR